MDRPGGFDDESHLSHRGQGSARTGVAGEPRRILRSAILSTHEIPEAAPEEFTLVDVGMRNPEHCSDLKRWLRMRPRKGQAIFCVRKDSHAEAVQAYALGATALLARPVSGSAVRAKFSEQGRGQTEAGEDFSLRASPGAAAGASVIRDIFEAVMSGGSIDASAVGAAGEAVADSIDENGLAPWIDIVRRHHSQTYQHCLLVTGVTVGFARHLGFSRADKQRIAAAGLLDGSGYPHGLEGNSISDLVRTITIADIFGALLERHSYKPPMDGAAAYEILLKMDGKLDRDLVREIRAIARV